MSDKSVRRIHWRRDKVRELTVKRYTQREIAAELQVSLGLVEKDIRFLKEQARENIRHYTDEQLPHEYQNCIDALSLIIKEMWLLEPEDNRELIQSRVLIKDCCAMLIELVGSGTLIDKAVKFIQRQRDLGHGRGLDDQNNKVTIDHAS